MATAQRRGSGLTAIMLVVGVVLLIAAVAGFVIAPEHRPATVATSVAPVNHQCPGVPGVFLGAGSSCDGPSRTVGLSRTAYDLARVATWAALIIGAVLVVLGLIRFAQRPGAV